MKRYRVFLFHWDSTGELLRHEIRDEWDEDVKALHRQNRERMIEWLTRPYGEIGIEEKLANLRDIGGQAFSIVAYHNRFYRQAREAFIVGAYYPTLTAACALGERILNHLILGLRDEYKGKPGHADVATDKSFTSWKIMIRALEGWGVLLPEAAQAFRALMKARHRAIHFNPATAERDREFAIQALKHLDEIISAQFGAFGSQPWFIPEAAGAAYIRKEWESDPFVKLVYLPASLLVTPYHRIDIDRQTGNGQSMTGMITKTGKYPTVSSSDYRKNLARIGLMQSRPKAMLTHQGAPNRSAAMPLGCLRS
jgi:hypothetical protein